ncbi:MAG: hypothetical protein O3A63_21045 [Proteobacteria bacterium]|nr:hypothetical protein [Pseudomonadota bacterium]
MIKQRDGQPVTTVAVAADHYRSTPDLIVRQRLEGVGALPARTASNDLDGH